MKNENIAINAVIFDLDGTLVCPRKRLYSLFVELTGCDLSFEEYWNLKAQGLNQAKMLGYVGYSDGSPEDFNEKWLKNVERADLIEKDEIFADVVSTLKKLKSEGIKIYLATNRRSVKNMDEELDKFGIKKLFDARITTMQKCAKYEAIKSANIDVSRAVFVGDSLEDIESATALNIPGILINRYGNSNQNMKANWRIKNLNELLEIPILFDLEYSEKDHK